MKTYKTLVKTAIFGFLSFCLLSACGPQDETAVPTAVRPEKVVPVTIETITRADLTETFTLPANLEAEEDLILSAEIAGSVQQIHFNEGEQVQAGKTLLEIDPDTIKSIIRRDQQNVTVVAHKLKRYKQLEADGLISKQELEELGNSLTAARVALQTSKLQLAKSFPQAPVSGIIDRIYVDRGEYVDPGKPLARLVKVDNLKVIANVPEKDVSFLKAGQQVEIIPASINSRSAESVYGVIEAIAFAADDITRTYRTKIVIDNKIAKLRPGMIVRAKFNRQKLEQVISVPLYAVMDRDGDKIVFLAKDGLARKIDVVIGSSIGQRIVVEQGLTINQSLIIGGQQLLVDGAKIKVGEN